MAQAEEDADMMQVGKHVIIRSVHRQMARAVKIQPNE